MTNFLKLMMSNGSSADGGGDDDDCDDVIGVMDTRAQEMLDENFTKVLGHLVKGTVDKEEKPHLADLIAGKMCGNCGQVGKAII